MCSIPVACQYRLSGAAIWLVMLVFLAGCGGGDNSATPTPQPIAPAPAPVPPSPPTPQPLTEQQRIDASRLLTQATFGIQFGQVDSVAAFLRDNSVEAWIQAQADLPITHHYPVAAHLRSDQEDQPGGFARPHRMDAWWRATLLADDQLRQRMALALSQFFVISEHSQLENFQVELAYYYDVLLNHAFGNFRDALQEITLSPAMGLYLSMMGNEKPQPALNIRPDENFAREIMQLFSLGLYELEQDGREKRDALGKRIPTYNQDVIEHYARIFTGWHFARKREETWHNFFVGVDFINPMEVIEAFHDTGEKRLIDNQVVPAGTAPGVALNDALDSLFNHPNVAPFVAKHFIAHFVTSNPSPAYVKRVADAFNHNQEGERGDMLAVITAVLTDPEARDAEAYTQNRYGRVKQPLVRAAQVLRAVLPPDTSVSTTNLAFRELTRIQEFTAQAPLSAPSVFNFFLPDHRVNGPLAELDMITPELQLMTSNNVVLSSNFVAYVLLSNDTQALRNRLGIDFSQHAAVLAQSQDEALSVLNHQVLQGDMTAEFKQVLIDYDNQIRNQASLEMRITEWLTLIFTSPRFAVQR
ncbi:DUF1800 domain-containing protein [Alteromonas oceanisediminis]|uniref:DUF1800 domain-containing protein n=1 Tax=Alteromonas oceanisediminis TaxID=2836180 RepID=UPI001BDA124B|nr:DUF1800 family protein [Alteromonas oceanisediminis]MBT0586266.1 DUF1800 family protein [Alteromonas oceanisediminis]